MRITISDTVVARVAAQRALAVPGVVALQADLGHTLLEAAGSVLGPDARRPRPAGASATVAADSATVSLTVVTRLGHNCRDLAQAVQREVAADVSRYTGLPVAVTVTIAEILLVDAR